MAIIMGNDCLEAIYGLMGWKGLRPEVVASSSLSALSIGAVGSLGGINRGDDKGRVCTCLRGKGRR